MGPKYGREQGMLRANCVINTLYFGDNLHMLHDHIASESNRSR